jgi:phosphoglycolate phosphatase-like HAD superfamily hydrolase
LRIEQYFDHLYASTPQGTPTPVKAADELVANTEVKVHYLPFGEHKPNPKVVSDICGPLKVSPCTAVYVGDSISRDIGMAKAAGLWAAWAEYGTH